MDEEKKRDSSRVGARGAAQNDGKVKAPSGRELSPKATEGECLIKVTILCERLLPPPRRSPSLSEGGLSRFFLVILKRASFDGIEKNLERLEEILRG